MKKKCICCGMEKDISEYYSHPLTADGHLNKCKECCKKQNKDNREKHLEYYIDGFKDGAEFGYNKANEWHFVKDGDIPKDEDYKLCITSNGNYYIARYEELFVHWSNQEYKEVCCPYAWKEITFPNEVKEND